MRILKLLLEGKKLGPLADFYENILALPVYRTPGEITIVIGDSSLLFRQATSTKNPFYHFAINIPANKIEEAKSWLIGKVDLLWIADYNSYVADFRNWNAKSIYFLDVEGNIVELIARSDLHNESAEPFSQAQLLSISEIGIVYRNEEIERNTEELMQRHGLRYFHRQPPFPQFKAVGDDQGLFIIVAEGRNWYPTAYKPAGRYPLLVTFEVEEKVYEEHF